MVIGMKVSAAQLRALTIAKQSGGLAGWRYGPQWPWGCTNPTVFANTLNALVRKELLEQRIRKDRCQWVLTEVGEKVLGDVV